VHYGYKLFLFIFSARQHAMHTQRDTVLANPSVCPSYCSTISKRIAYVVKRSPVSGRSMIDPSFFSATAVTKFQREISSVEVLNTLGVGKFAIFDRNRRLSRKRYEIGPWLLRITDRICSRSIRVSSNHRE